jgi:hypothetical protein
MLQVFAYSAPFSSIDQCLFISKSIGHDQAMTRTSIRIDFCAENESIKNPRISLHGGCCLKLLSEGFDGRIGQLQKLCKNKETPTANFAGTLSPYVARY